MVPYQSAWSIAMPNNYIIGFEVDDPALERRKIAAARGRLATIADAILADARCYDVQEGVAAC
jgi:hypothetical protein